jgi:hypothetical protein
MCRVGEPGVIVRHAVGLRNAAVRPEVGEHRKQKPVCVAQILWVGGGLTEIANVAVSSFS